jgi:hypothetical protein
VHFVSVNRGASCCELADMCAWHSTTHRRTGRSDDEDTTEPAPALAQSAGTNIEWQNHTGNGWVYTSLTLQREDESKAVSKLQECCQLCLHAVHLYVSSSSSIFAPQLATQTCLPDVSTKCHHSVHPCLRFRTCCDASQHIASAASVPILCTLQMGSKASWPA